MPRILPNAPKAHTAPSSSSSEAISFFSGIASSEASSSFRRAWPRAPRIELATAPRQRISAHCSRSSLYPDRLMSLHPDRLMAYSPVRRQSEPAVAWVSASDHHDNHHSYSASTYPIRGRRSGNAARVHRTSFRTFVVSARPLIGRHGFGMALGNPRLQLLKRAKDGISRSELPNMSRMDSRSVGTVDAADMLADPNQRMRESIACAEHPQVSVAPVGLQSHGRCDILW